MKKIIAVALATVMMLFGLVGLGAPASADVTDPLPANGVTSLTYTNSTWTITLASADASEVKMISPVQEIVCSEHEGEPKNGHPMCSSTSYSFKSTEKCVMVQVDWTNNKHNSSDPRACHNETGPPTLISDPHIQDYLPACDAESREAKFVLDNTGSTEAVTYTINGAAHIVGAGLAAHVPAGIVPAEGKTFMITAGEKNWSFTVEPCEPPRPEQPQAETRTKVTDVCKAATRVTDHYTTEYVWSDSAKAWVLGKEKWSHKVSTPLSASECGYETVVREKVTIDCKPGGKNFAITDNYKREWSFDAKSKQWVLGKEIWVGKSKVPATDTQCPPPVEPTPEPTDPEPTDPPTTTPPTEEPTEPPATEEPTEEPTEPPVVTPEPTEPPVTEEPSEEPTEPVKTPPATETPASTPAPAVTPEAPVRNAQRQAAPAPAVNTKVERAQAPVAELAHTGANASEIGIGALIVIAIGGLLFGASYAGKRRQD